MFKFRMDPDADINYYLCSKIIQLMKCRKINVKDMMSSFGTSSTAKVYYRIYNPENITIGELRKVCRKLDISVHDLLERE